MIIALENGRILTRAGFVDGGVLIEDGRIAAVVRGRAEAADARRDLGGRRLVPGFIDTQVNGGGGVLFNDSPTVETIVSMASVDRRSAPTTVARPPSARIPSAASCARPGTDASRTWSATAAPSAANAAARVGPTPPPAPVMRTTRSASPRSMAVRIGRASGADALRPQLVRAVRG